MSRISTIDKFEGYLLNDQTRNIGVVFHILSLYFLHLIINTTNRLKGYVKVTLIQSVSIILTTEHCI